MQCHDMQLITGLRLSLCLDATYGFGCRILDHHAEWLQHFISTFSLSWVHSLSG